MRDDVAASACTVRCTRSCTVAFFCALGGSARRRIATFIKSSVIECVCRRGAACAHRGAALLPPSVDVELARSVLRLKPIELRRRRVHAARVPVHNGVRVLRRLRRLHSSIWVLGLEGLWLLWRHLPARWRVLSERRRRGRHLARRTLLSVTRIRARGCGAAGLPCSSSVCTGCILLTGRDARTPGIGGGDPMRWTL